MAGGEIAYDEASARTIIFTRGRVIAYGATAHVWDVAFDASRDSVPPITPPGPSDRGAAAPAYDPINQRTLAIGGARATEGDWIDADDVVAFDLGTRTWAELLAPSVD